MTGAGDLSRLRAARLQARKCVDFYEENLERLAREAEAEQAGLTAARASLDECERQIKAATTPLAPRLENDR